MDNSQELLALYGLQKSVKAKLSDLENKPQTCDVCRAAAGARETLRNVERMIDCTADCCHPTFHAYQLDARRTQRTEWNDVDRLTHALRGLAAEVGEINSIFQKAMQGHAVCQDDIVEEIGDVLWFLCELADSHGIELGEAARRNMVKRLVRYPGGFNKQDSINRIDHA